MDSLIIEKVDLNQNIEVIYEDNHLLVLNKPSGVLSQKDITGDDSIIEWGKKYLKHKYNKPGNVFLGLAHRLDRPVSGSIILCRTSKSLSRMTKLIKNRELTKKYYALVGQKPAIKSQTLTSFIKKSPKSNKVVISSKPFEDAKKSILSYTVVKSINGCTLLDIELATGRKHQIRSQLLQINSPILGDLKYGYDKPLPDKSIALHSYQVQFIHPVNKEELTIIAPWPDKKWWNSFK